MALNGKRPNDNSNGNAHTPTPKRQTPKRQTPRRGAEAVLTWGTRSGCALRDSNPQPFDP